MRYGVDENGVGDGNGDDVGEVEVDEVDATENWVDAGVAELDEDEESEGDEEEEGGEEGP